MHRVALLDDHPAVLAGLRRLVDAEPDLEVVAAGLAVGNVAQQLERTRADVLITDYDLGPDDGLAYCLRTKRRDDAPAVIIYSADSGPALTLAARAAGADATVDKAEPMSRLLAAIRAVVAGKRMLPAVPPHAFEAAVVQARGRGPRGVRDAPGRRVRCWDRASAARRGVRHQPPSAADRGAAPAGARHLAPRCREPHAHATRWPATSRSCVVIRALMPRGTGPGRAP